MSYPMGRVELKKVFGKGGICVYKTVYFSIILAFIEYTKEGKKLWKKKTIKSGP